MNKEYMYVNGKVVVEDDKQNKRLEEYSDNLDEILVQENLIENLEENIKKLELQDKCFLKIKNKKRYISWSFITIFIFLSTIFPVYVNFLIKLSGATWDKGSMIAYALCFIIGMGLIALIEVQDFQRFKHTKKCVKGIEKQLEYARKELVLAKEKLVNLNNAKTVKKESSEVNVIKVNDIEKLTELQENLEMFFNLGYNDKEESQEKQLVLTKKR